MKTKKHITIIGAALLLSVPVWTSAQNNSNGGNNNLPSNTDAFGKGTNVLGIGVGVGGDYNYVYPGYSSTPNLVLTYDNGTFDKVGPGIISLGGLFSYKGVSYTGIDANGYPYNNNWNYYIIGFRAAYHWNFTTSSRFDPYLGLMLAYYDITNNISFNDPYYHGVANPYGGTYGSYTALSLYLGARYYVSNKVALWLELGFGYSNAALGVSFKF